MDDALRWRLDAVLALLALIAVLLAALVGAANPAALVAALLVGLAALGAGYVLYPAVASGALG
jgi:hypothetical protein